MKARVTFDTLAYANRLKAAGLESKIAETQAEAKAEVLASLMEDVLVTKQDLIGFATKQDLTDLATKTDLKHLEARLEARFERIDTQFKELNSKFATKDALLRIESRMEKLGTELTLRLGGMIIASLAGLTAFTSYFHLIH